MTDIFKEKQYPTFHHTQPDQVQQMVNTERGYWSGRDPEAEINGRIQLGVLSDYHDDGFKPSTIMGALGLLILFACLLK
jgi:hypothetical protein